ncbi:MAG TPA: hypothetical protein VHQ01_02605 [Pyrinomonadaceae bacterium]|nr:hypothetical protein [Pyrinomonadaceae bacterium]
MFCPKCGGQNPETGKFCRSCGTDLGNVSQALTGALPPPRQILDHKGRPVSWDRAIPKLFTGIAFLAVTCALAFSGTGRGWWYWMLIPAFTSLGAGLAQLIQLRKAEKGGMMYSPTVLPPAQNTALPPPQTQWVAPDSKYKTGDLVPPSVTDNTTRHLEIDSEGQTMNLPKK